MSNGRREQRRLGWLEPTMTDSNNGTALLFVDTDFWDESRT